MNDRSIVERGGLIPGRRAAVTECRTADVGGDFQAAVIMRGTEAAKVEAGGGNFRAAARTPGDEDVSARLRRCGGSGGRVERGLPGRRLRKTGGGPQAVEQEAQDGGGRRR